MVCGRAELFLEMHGRHNTHRVSVFYTTLGRAIPLVRQRRSSILIAGLRRGSDVEDGGPGWR